MDIFFRTSSGSLGSVLDSHAGGLVLIPDASDSVMRAVVGSEEGERSAVKR